ncbi:YqhG family protein [Paenibacillus oenotherae]|uniref:YqhG family protein n=1 Tax=Paenibacillus oenotherae TaxID=1435645 RepID=A0ABS7D390_9BACL|nr:YqhG family protein [Paenibacillus oenotherae]MBW7474331.1 YqhG family protein [Paenibacillus oenotherae]
MNEKQVHKFVQRYLESTGCRIIEKSPSHFHVKLSPRADRDLTNRPFYWSFVDRTGADPETMSMLLITDKVKYDAANASHQSSGSFGGSSASAPASSALPGTIGTAQGGSMAEAAAAALGRSLGHVHGSLNTSSRIPKEELHYGSRKLEQLFESARCGGSYVCLFQEPDKRGTHPFHSTPYTAWLGVNMKIEFACDMKREEFHSFGVSLTTGQCAEGFHERLLKLRLTPRLPPNVHIAKNAVTLNKAVTIIEGTIERRLRSYDFRWAELAAARLQDELATINHYYDPLLESAEEENRPAIQEQYERRQNEIRWQYEPRITVSAMNCGIFYLQGIG